MLLKELSRYIGQTVTIFTVSGGATGFGFTGVLLRINVNFLTLVNRLGSLPSNQHDSMLSSNGRFSEEIEDMQIYVVTSFCDIPINRIVAICHNSLF